MKILNYGRVYLGDDDRLIIKDFHFNCEGVGYETLSADIEDVDMNDPRLQRDLLSEIIRLHLTGERVLDHHGKLVS